MLKFFQIWPVWALPADSDVLEKYLHDFLRTFLFSGTIRFMTNLDSILRCSDTTLPTKVHLIKAMVFPVVMYGCDSWTVKNAEHQRIDAFELWCWRRLLRVPWTARRSGQSILKEISPGCPARLSISSENRHPHARGPAVCQTQSNTLLCSLRCQIKCSSINSVLIKLLWLKSLEVARCGLGQRRIQGWDGFWIADSETGMSFSWPLMELRAWIKNNILFNSPSQGNVFFFFPLSISVSWW